MTPDRAWNLHRTLSRAASGGSDIMPDREKALPRSLPLILLLAAALLFWPAAPASAAPKRSARPEQIFRAIYPTAPRTLDPHAAVDPAAWPVIMAAYDRLMFLAPGTAKPVPNLGTPTDGVVRQVAVSPNGLRYTFALNEGWTFADGTVINSEAVLFSFDRLMSTPVGKLYYPHLKSFEVIGPYTFRMVLSRPWPPFLASLALPQASLVSPGLRGRPANYLDRHTLGSGRYQVYDWKDGTIGLAARSDLLSPPPVAFAMFHYEPDPRKRYEKMIAHQAHLTVAPSLPPEGLGAQYQARKVPTYSVRYVAFNTRRPYTRMQNVRRALSFILSDAFHDRPGRLVGPFPPGLFYNAPSRVAPPDVAGTDPLEQGRAILRDVGPPAGPLTLALKSGDRALAEDAGVIERTLRALGVPVRVVSLDGGSGRQIMETGDYDLFLDTRTPDLPAADMWLGRFLDTGSSVDGNPAWFHHDRADQLIRDIAETVGREGDGPNDIVRIESERAVKLEELADLARTEAPYAFLYRLERLEVADVRLSALEPHPLWPEVWPLSSPSGSVDLKPFSFRSGANPTGRPPAAPESSAAAPDEDWDDGTAWPRPAPPAATEIPPTPAPAPSGSDARPHYDDFIGMELD